MLLHLETNNMNIIWKKTDKSIAISYITSEYIQTLINKALEDGIITSEEDFVIAEACKSYATQLQESGAIPAEWKVAAVNVVVPVQPFRDAWEWDGKKKTVVINQTKAADVTKNILRDLRIGKLKDLDLKYMISLEDGSDTSDIVAEKKYLRNITDLVTPEMSIDDMIKFIEDFKER